MEHAMKSTFSFALALALAACSPDAGGDPLVGSWGGESFQVSATPLRVEIALSCGATVRIRHAIIADASGRFTVQDSVRGALEGGFRSSSLGVSMEPATISGQLIGDVLTLDVQLQRFGGDHPRRYEGRRGEPDVDSQPCQA
jgi:hypothetical protein